MRNIFGNLRDLVGYISNQMIHIKKTSKLAVGMTVAVAGTTTGVAFAASNTNAESLGLDEIYHVYYGENHIGSVEDPDEIDEYIEEQKNAAQARHNDIELVTGEEINYVRELVFNSDVESEKVMTNLDENLTFATEAVELLVNDQSIGYVKDIEMANKALNGVINESLPKDLQSNSFTFIKQKENKLILPKPMLEDMTKEEIEQSNEEEKTIVLPKTVTVKQDSAEIDVSFTENVVVTKDRVNPTKLLEVEQLTKLIKRGISIAKEKPVENESDIETIAKTNNLSTDELIDLNPGLDDVEIIQAGETIKVTQEKNFIDVVYTVEKTEEESIDYETVTKNSNEIYKGNEKVKQQGEKGKKVLTFKVTTKNGKVINEEKVIEEVVKEPKDKIILKGTKQISNRGSGQLGWPAVGGRITSKMGPRWGSYHKGIDIAGVGNRTIKSADNGTVVQASWDGAYGNRVVINHNNGFKTTYSHLSSMSVSPGQTVKKGQSIGQMGTTGRSTGVHLHFEVYRNGALVNPLNYVGR
ncbi:peptidoglycan DD-metalloendopeptidase family protein [Allobacillus sp. GCM10007491]|uniref:Peptidoglycan DD-metalloendopeptidase family protein n=2 Tax=Allobacillus saliphilus TaxID=2912308 RepID=A0A941CYP1_9BACI|nr:peptidoglycan DD-metalloendopeptidase family protein [Allobacillus saliphilus]